MPITLDRFGVPALLHQRAEWLEPLALTMNEDGWHAFDEVARHELYNCPVVYVHVGPDTRVLRIGTARYGVASRWLLRAGNHRAAYRGEIDNRPYVLFFGRMHNTATTVWALPCCPYMMLAVEKYLQDHYGPIFAAFQKNCRAYVGIHGQEQFSSQVDDGVPQHEWNQNLPRVADLQSDQLWPWGA